MERWIWYREGTDQDAVAWLGAQGAADKTSTTTNVRQLADKESAVNLNMGTLVGSYESIARMLDEVATVPNTGGVLLTFDDFLVGTEMYGTRIQPLMKCREGVEVAA
jgi:pyrimidine oxygenase